MTAWTGDGVDGGECPSLLLRMLESLNEIDWKKDSVFAITRNKETNLTVMDFLDARSRAADQHIIPGDRYFISKEEALNLEIEYTFIFKLDENKTFEFKSYNFTLNRVPSDVYLSSLERRHAQLIFDNWSHSISSCISEVKDEIKKMPSVGLFLKSNDQLVCWMVSNPPFGMGLLFTLEDYRRRGYAKLVTHCMAKRMAQSGFLPYVTIVQGNSSSFAFFRSLGFRPLICSIYGLLRSPSLE